ncbi:TonB-dependent receptor domain-containing protein [Sporomusa termitida]|uniref:Colicin I receptor n=1 Tax=Sporomusa termitida TaxID=2377 RepID=A0A517DQB0_9FIRM|nr:TonB-dependent receptor [Sporomusa termitida]QDR79541.1 Colicin I receptor [Sporomusa termitida]
MSFDNKPNKSKIGILAISLSVAMSLPAYAAEEDYVYQFDEVVVTASGFEQDIADAPASITVITKEEINRRGYTDLGGILSDVEGVDVRGSSTGRMGVANISIRGLGSEYTLFLIDGIPQNGTTDVGPNGFIAGVGSFVPPLATIERIEIIRGPMSTLYGSEALGGVVNIITKKVDDEWRHNLTLDHTFYEDSDRGSISRYSFYSSGPVTEDKVGLALRGNFLRRAGSSGKDALGNVLPDAGAAANPSPLRNYSLGGKVTWKQDDQNSLWLDADTAISDYGGKVDRRIERDKLTVGSDNKVSYGDWHTTLTYNSTELKGYMHNNTDRKLKNPNIIFETKLVAPVSEVHRLTVGGRYWHEKLEDGALTIGGVGKLSNQTASLFAEDEWRLQDDLALTYGARYDRHRYLGGHVSPRGYLVWKADDKWTLKGGVSTGFKAPTLSQSVDGVSGFTGGAGNPDPIHVYGNPDLKPEESVNKEVGFYYQSPSGFSANATLFHTDFKNKINGGVDLGVIDGHQAQTYENVGKAKTNGLEFGSKIPLAEDLSLNLNYTYTMTEQIGGDNDGAPLNNIPKNAVNARLNWQTDEKTTTWLRAEYRGKMNRYTRKQLSATEQGVVDALGQYFKAYTVLDLGVSRKLSENVTLNFAVNNVLDKDFGEAVVINGGTYYKYFSTGKESAGTYLTGRNYWVSMNYNF